jgi:hypothetical protein
MNTEIIASRRLQFKCRNTEKYGNIVIEIYKPYLLREEMVDFPISSGNSGCSVKVIGLETDYYDQEVYGADAIQALQLATDIEGILKHIDKKFELFFEDGEPYFE